MLALLRRGPQRLHAHPPPSPLCSLLPASSTEVGTRTAGTAPRRTLRHALSGEFIGFPGSCSSPARGAAQGGPRARAAEFKSAGPARRGAADGGRFRPAHNFPNTWGQGLRGVEPESSRWMAVQACGAGTVRPAGSRACDEALVSLGLPLGLRCGSVQPPRGGPGSRRSEAEDSPESSLAPPRAGHPREREKSPRGAGPARTAGLGDWRKASRSSMEGTEMTPRSPVC